MAEPVLHAAVLVAVVALLWPRWRYVLVVGVAAVLPDFDLLLGAHRSATHSLVVLVPVALGVWLWRRRVGDGRAGALVLLGLVSHLLLDVGAPLPLLWPVVPGQAWLAVRLDAQLHSVLALIPHVRVAWSPGAVGDVLRSPAPFTAPVFTTEGLLAAALLLGAAALRVRRARGLSA